MRSYVGRQLEQLPGQGLRIVLFKVGKEFSVRKVLQSRRVVPHPVGVPVDEGGDVAVAMDLLVSAGVVAELSGGGDAGDCTAAHS